jgi:DNA-binding response OmpR family regulator
MNAAAPHELLEVGPLQILPEDHLARAGGRALILSIRELRLLTELARRVDRVVAREELFSLVWGRELRPGDRSVDVYVRRLRVKLERALPEWSFIHTHFGFGYRMAAERTSAPTPVSHLANTGGARAAVTVNDQQ